MQYDDATTKLDGRHFENPFIAITQPYFDELWCTDADFDYKNEHRPKKSTFCKFMMADGRHIENGFIVIYQPRII